MDKDAQLLRNDHIKMSEVWYVGAEWI